MTRISQEPVSMIQVRSLRPDKQLPTYDFLVWEHRKSSFANKDQPSIRLRAFLRRNPDIFDDPKIAEKIPEADVDLLGEIAERYGSVFDIGR